MPHLKLTSLAVILVLADAKQALLNQEIGGFLVIPENFYKDLLLGKSPTLSYAGDASFFLVYGTIIEGLAKAGGHTRRTG